MLSAHKHKGTFAKIRNSPQFFLPLLLVCGYALASFAYTSILENNGVGNRDLQQVVASAHESNFISGYVESNPDQISVAISEATPEWNQDNPYQVVSSVKVPPSNIYLFNSKKTRNYFSSIGENYDLILAQWHYYLNSRRIKYLDIQDADLTTGLKSGILILPSTIALSSEERAAIQIYEKRGGNVLATWATGTRNVTGELVGYDFLNDQFGINVSGEITVQEKEKFLIVSGDTPITTTLPTGSRIWLGLNTILEAPLRVSGGDNVAARFMDVVRSPSIANNNEAIVYTERGSSRRIYFAFAENSWRFEQANIYTLLDDVFNWLQRRPGTYLANWPFPYRAAQIIEMDTEQGFQNASNLADMLDSYGYQGTFYCLTSVATQYPDVVKNLEHNHEIAYHGDIHNAFKGQAKEDQSKRLDTMQLELRPLVTTPSKLRGFRPPYELGDQVVESLLFEKGFGHILPNSDDTQAMLPYISSASPEDFQKGLIVLPRTQRDDMNFIRDGLSSQEMTMTMNKDFDQAHEYGALGILSVHSQNFKPDNPVAQSIKQFLAHIKSSGNKTWVASSGTIESWWRNRALFKSKLTGKPKKMLLNITVEKPGLHWSTALVISNPIRGLQLNITTTDVGKTLPVLEPLDDYRTAIVFNALEAGSYSYYLSY